MLVSPGRNVRHSDMIPVGLLSMNKHQMQIEPGKKMVNQWQIIGTWNPTEPLFEVIEFNSLIFIFHIKI